MISFISISIINDKAHKCAITISIQTNEKQTIYIYIETENRKTKSNGGEPIQSNRIQRKSKIKKKENKNKEEEKNNKLIIQVIIQINESL